MLKKLYLIIGLMWFVGGGPAQAQDLSLAITRLQDQINMRELDAFIGPVDYELIYVKAGLNDPEVVVLEESEERSAIAPAQGRITTESPARGASSVALDKAQDKITAGNNRPLDKSDENPGQARANQVRPATFDPQSEALYGKRDVRELLALGGRSIVRIDTVLSRGRERLIVYSEDPIQIDSTAVDSSVTVLRVIARVDTVFSEDFMAFVEERGRAKLEKTLPTPRPKKEQQDPVVSKRRTKEDLPRDLREANVAQIKQRSGLSVAQQNQNLRLAVRPAAIGSRYNGERLSLAENELDIAGRRQLRWDARKMYKGWPAGSLLRLNWAGEFVKGDGYVAPVNWKIMHRGSPDSGHQILAEGQVQLTFKEVDGVLKLSGIERLIAAISLQEAL